MRPARTSNTPGLLLHPYLGERQCRAGIIRWSENLDRGGFAVFDLEFVEEGQQASPLSVTDTASGLLDRALKLLPIIKRAYAIICLGVKHPGYILGLAENLFGQVGRSHARAASGNIAGLRSTIAGIAVRSTNWTIPDQGAKRCFRRSAERLDRPLAAALPSDPVTGTVPTLAQVADITGGLRA